MKLGKKLAINRAKYKEGAWASKLDGNAKAAYVFFKDTADQIREDIEAGYTVESICVPASFNYEKNIRAAVDNNFAMVIINFVDDLKKDGLQAVIVKMPENDINRYGDYDHYIHINPIL